jgi:hypothetical protein
MSIIKIIFSFQEIVPEETILLIVSWDSHCQWVPAEAYENSHTSLKCHFQKPSFKSRGYSSISNMKRMVEEPSWGSFVAEFHLHANTAVSISQSHHQGFHVLSPKWDFFC